MKNGESASALVRSLDRDPEQPSRVVYEKAVSYCEKLGHGANSCHDYPNRGRSCLNCRRSGHGAKTCWSGKNLSHFSRRNNQDKAGYLQEQVDSFTFEKKSNLDEEGEESDAVKVIFENKERKKNRVLSIKRGADEKHEKKQARQYGHDPMPIESPLSPETGQGKKMKRSQRSSKKKKSENKKTKPRRQTFKTGRPEKYEVVSALTNAPSGLSFEQLRKGDAARAQKKLEHIFGREKLKLGVVEKRDSDENDAEEICLAVSVVHILGMRLQALLDTSATPNFLPLRAVRKLSLSFGDTRKEVPVATGAKYGAAGKIASLPVLLDDLQAEVDFMVPQNVPLDFIIGRLTTKILGDVLDFPAEVLRLNYRAQTAVIPMMLKYMQSRNISEATSSNDFTSKSGNGD